MIYYEKALRPHYKKYRCNNIIYTIDTFSAMSRDYTVYSRPIVIIHKYNIYLYIDDHVYTCMNKI